MSGVHIMWFLPLKFVEKKSELGLIFGFGLILVFGMVFMAINRFIIVLKVFLGILGQNGLKRGFGVKKY